MNFILKTALVVAGAAIATQAVADVTFYENENFQGRSFTAKKQVNNFKGAGFNDRASSIVVLRDRWEACEDVRFGGHCVVLRPGRYASLRAMGLNNRISSVRMIAKKVRIDESRYAPETAAAYDSRRRENERVYQATVTSVRAVVGPPEQRCWIEREQVVQDRSNDNVGQAIAGIFGYQTGSGQPVYKDVQRCASVPNQGRPDHWDVTYIFRGQEHRMQMTAPPGPTVTVNGKGEPRA